ncbi:unnamed protein product [Urochloa humidicola]
MAVKPPGAGKKTGDKMKPGTSSSTPKKQAAPPRQCFPLLLNKQRGGADLFVSAQEGEGGGYGEGEGEGYREVCSNNHNSAIRP